MFFYFRIILLVLLSCALAVLPAFAQQPDSLRPYPITDTLAVVEVSATRATLGAVVGANSYISGQQLRQYNNGTDLPFLIQQSTAAVATSDAGTGIGYTGLRLRGTDATRIDVTINDVPINDAESHQVYWVDMPDLANATSSVQIQRGVGSSSNGVASFGGSINLQTLQQQPKAYGQCSVGGGSFGTQRYALSGGTGLLGQQFSVDGRLSYIASNGYIDRATADLRSYFVAANYYGNRHSLRLLSFGGHELTYQAWEGVPDYIIDTNRTYNPYTYAKQVDNYRQNHLQLHYGYRINHHLTAKINLHYTRGAGYYEQYKTDQYLTDYGINPLTTYNIIGYDTIWLDRTDLVRQRWLRNHFGGFTYAVMYHHKHSKWVVGGAANRYIGQHFGDIIWAALPPKYVPLKRYYDGNGRKTAFNIFAKIEQRFAQHYTAFADVQYRQIDYQIDGTDPDRGSLDIALRYRFLNPKAGISWQPNPRHHLSAWAGIAQREPTRANIIDNPNLPKPETLYDYEWQYRHQARHWQAQLTAYYMYYRQQLVLTGNLNDVGTPIQQNVERSYRTGIEAELTAQLHPHWQLVANVALSRNKIAAFSQQTTIYTDQWQALADTSLDYQQTDIAFSPPIVAGASLLYLPIENLQIAWVTKYVSKQYLDNTQNAQRQLRAYWVNNLHAEYQLLPKRSKWCKAVRLNVQVNNVLNSLYEANGWTYFVLQTTTTPDNTHLIRPTNYNSYYPQAGIHVLAGLSIDIGNTHKGD